MDQSSPFAAEILEAGATAYAAFAASRLLERHPEIAARFAPSAMASWKGHLTQRLHELGAAVSAGEPALFVARVNWARKAFLARDLDEQDLLTSLLCLRDVLSEELPENAADEAAEYLAQAIAAFDTPTAADSLELDPSGREDILALKYLLAVLEGEPRRGIDVLLEAVDEGLPVRKAYLDVLLPAQREVGRMWHAAELSIAEEHLVTETTQRAMALLSGRSPTKNPNGKTVIAAAVAGNVHDIAIRMIADFFEMEGWRAICLGADVPAPDLATAIGHFDADLLVLSAALTTQLKRMRQTIDTVRKLGNPKTKIMVGGMLFAETPELWERLGADGFAQDPDAAILKAAQLVGLG